VHKIGGILDFKYSIFRALKLEMLLLFSPLLKKNMSVMQMCKCKLFSALRNNELFQYKNVIVQ
jgi:hypothetical protein